MIVDDQKLIFIHIPKNAGTSVEAFLGHYPMIGVELKHIGISEVKKRFPKAYNSYRKFTIIRNPYDRMVSWFFFLKKRIKTKYYETENFNEWIKNSLEIQKDINEYIDESVEEIKYLFDLKGFVNSNRFLDPQYTWIDDTVEVIKFENINEGISSFFNKKIKLPVKNASNHDYYLEYYNQNSLDIVYKRYKKDFKKFNYKKI